MRTALMKLAFAEFLVDAWLRIVFPQIEQVPFMMPHLVVVDAEAVSTLVESGGSKVEVQFLTVEHFHVV